MKLLCEVSHKYFIQYVYSIIFHRKNDANFLNRVHDCSLCVDRNPKSTHYGRVWAFAKMVDTDLPEPQWGTNDVTFLGKYSDDNGITWSVAQDLTNLFPDDATQKSPGITPGITLSNGTLVFPTYFSRVENSVTKQYASFIYSTNSETWQSGDITIGYGGENSIIQLADGKLLMNARDAFSTGWKKRRVYTLDAIGAGWVNRPEYEVITTVNVQESLMFHRGVYLYSQPTGHEDNTGRSNITIFKSRDLINWEKLIEITSAPSNGYSSLILRDNKLGILFEDINPYDIVYSNLNYLLPIVYS